MGVVGQGYGIAFDRNAALPFNIHIVENLVLKVSLIADAGKLNQAIRQRGFAVINMSDNAEVSDVFHNSLLKKALHSDSGGFYIKYFLIN